MDPPLRQRFSSGWGMVLAISFLEAAIVAFAAALAALIIQLAAVRPALVRRSNTVLAGGSGGPGWSRSRVHYAYIVLEAVKVIALLTTGILLITS